MTSALKKVMRKDIAQLLSTLSKEEIKTRSEAALITVNFISFVSILDYYRLKQLLVHLGR